MSKQKAAKEPEKGMYAARTMQFTKTELDKLTRANHHHQQVIWDEALRARHQARLCVLVSKGPKHTKRATVSFRAIFYLPSHPGKPHYMKIGRWGPHEEFTYPWKVEDPDDPKKRITKTIKCDNIDAVRRAAIDIFNRAKSGIDPRRPEASGIFEDVVKEYLDDRKSQRTFNETKYLFETFIVPEWSGKNSKMITDVKRSDVVKLLDKIKAGEIKGKNGNKVGTHIIARAAFAQLRTLFNWNAVRSDTFNTPLVKGMTDKRKLDKVQSRDRTLKDHEIRAMWPLLTGIYGAMFRFALLSGQRIGTVSKMRRSDVKHDQEIDRPVWDPRDDDPEKKAVSEVPLSKMAQDVIASVPIIDGDNDYVFSFDGRRPVRNSRHYPKKRIDEELKKVLPDMEDWVIHDLRRTARTLMAEEGVTDRVAEQCLGHKIKGIEGVYNRHKYLVEKRNAFDKLANRLEHIINPPSGNVFAIADQARRARKS
jgi:integrase